MLTIGIFPNTKKQDVKNVLGKVIQYFHMGGVDIKMPQDAAAELGCPELASTREQLVSKIDIALTIGGDGTLLNTAREVAPAGIPLCGINMGQLGFLTEIELSDLTASLSRILKRDYSVEERLMLEASVKRGGQSLPISSALNDVVVAKGGFSRMIRLNLFLDSELTTTYPADGLIIATPTGSTGYSLSAGGPIVDPGLGVVLLTPICPHSLHARSLIVSEMEEVSVTFQATHDDIVLTVDGQTLFNLCPDDTVIVRRAPFRARFIKLHGNSYYQTLRNKLQGD